MKAIVKGAAIASVLMLTAGSAAWAQTYSTNPGTQGSYSSNPGSYTYGTTQGNYGTNQGTSGASQGTYSNQGNWNPTNQGASNTGNQSGWNQGMQGTSTPYSGQSYSHAGYGAGNVTTYQEAEQQLAKYGYNNVQDLRSMQGWSADAMRNGQRVHVIIGDNGLVATFPGR